jgi:phosphoglycolate phosphatase-like HAD superfamily hydrolase
MTSMAFDLDGTIIDCRERQCLLAFALCRAVGLQLEIDKFWHAKREGATTYQALANCLGDQSIATSLAARWVAQIEQEQWLRLDRILPEVSGLLDIIQTAGIQLHLITARTDKLALYRQLSWLGIRNAFASINVVSPKNATAEKASFLSEIRPLFFVGDTESDYSAAHASQTPFKAVATGQRSKKFLAGAIGPQTDVHEDNLPSTIRRIIDAAQCGNRPA